MKSVFCSDFPISSKRERDCACLKKENRSSYKVFVTVVRTNKQKKSSIVVKASYYQN